MTHLILALILFQNPSLDSASPKERQAAVEEMATLGNREAIPRLAEFLKKEPRSDVRAKLLRASDAFETARRFQHSRTR